MRKPPSSQALKRGLPPVHPGAILREDVLPALKAAGVTQQAVADHLKITRQALDNLAKGKASVSPEMALRLGKLCGNGPDLWLNLQQAWDLAEARGRIGDQLAAIPTLTAAA